MSDILLSNFNITNLQSLIPAPIFLQTITTLNSTNTSTTATIPLDNTIPQSSEGTAFSGLDTAITPQFASSRMRIEVTINVAGSKITQAIAALFRDSGADAIGVGDVAIGGSGFTHIIRFTADVATGSTTPTTFKIRYGADSTDGGTIYINQYAATTPIFNGTFQSSVVVTEYNTLGSALPPVASSVLPRSYLAGYTLSNDINTPTSVLDIAVGAAKDSTNTQDINLVTPITKSIASTWTVGTGNGGLDIGTVGIGSYHVYSILRTDTGVVDALFSLANNNSGTTTMTIASPCVVTWANHGLQIGSSVKFSTTGALPTGITSGITYYVISAGFGTGSFEIAATQGGSAINTTGSQSGVHTASSVPTLPASYGYYRRIGSISYASATITAFHQQGNHFTLDQPVRDQSAATLTSAGATYIISIPVGISMETDMVVGSNAGSTTGVLAYSFNAAAPAMGGVNFPFMIAPGAGGSGIIYTFSARISSGTAAQVKLAATATCNLFLITLGWFDSFLQ